jgi:indolepyruvate ferredoxin oxidoreductase beta subunit
MNKLATEKVKEFNVLIAGVGGQGNLLSSEIIATAAVKEGLGVRAADVFGAAQRGGSVLGHVRIGSEVFSPVIHQGAADVLLGFEPVESLRALRFLSPSCTAIVNTRPIYPRDVSIGEATYPSIPEIASILQKAVKKLIHRDFIKMAEKAGSSRTLNVVMVGSLAGLEFLPIAKETFLEALAETLPREAREMNLRAFEFGYAESKRETD